MSRFVLTAIACLIACAASAGPYCRPPPPGLSFDDWANACVEEIDYAYQMYGGGMDYDYFVENLYGMYLNPPQPAYNGGVTPLGQCAPEGATQCNSSGWLYTCTNGQWLTGSVKCGN
jgi:hypothetical protein